MRILITGASGFIGSQFVRASLARGHDVMALSSSCKMPLENQKNVYKWRFGEPLPANALEGVDCSLHLAYDFNGARGARSTVDSTLSAVEEMRGKGVKRQFFFSSYSASSNADSLYGSTKYAMEEAFKDQPDVIIVRPGLVLGLGGIYGRIRKCAQIMPIIPLPDGGAGKVPVIRIEALCKIILNYAGARECPGELNIFERDLKSLRDLVLEAANENKRCPYILPVPSRIVMGFLSLAETMHLPLPVNSDNLKGFLANQESTHKSSIENIFK